MLRIEQKAFYASDCQSLVTVKPEDYRRAHKKRCVTEEKPQRTRRGLEQKAFPSRDTMLDEVSVWNCQNLQAGLSLLGLKFFLSSILCVNCVGSENVTPDDPHSSLCTKSSLHSVVLFCPWTVIANSFTH